MLAELERRGDEVFTVGRRRSPRERHFEIGDVTDAEALALVVDAARPDVVFHLAGTANAADPAEFYRVNTIYAVALLEALARTGHAHRPILLVGSAAEYGFVSADELPISEELPARPYHHGGASKAAQTLTGLMAARKGRPVVVARPFNVIGAGMPESLLLGSLVRQVARIARGRQAPIIRLGNLDTERDFVAVGDVVRAYADLLRTERAQGEIVNVCAGRPFPVRALAARLVALSGRSIDLVSDPARARAEDPRTNYGSPRKLASLVGYVPGTDLDAALAAALDEAMRGRDGCEEDEQLTSTRGARTRG